MVRATRSKAEPMQRDKRTTNKKSTGPGQSCGVVSNRAWLQWLVALLVAVVTCAALFPALSNDFVNWDDDRNLIDNSYYRGLGWEQLKWMFTTFHMGHYQPLSWVTFGIDYLIWGMDPFGYHLTNLLLHAANAVLFYFVSRQLLSAALSIPAGEETWRLGASAGLAALLFAMHPLRVESVAWATERRDVLSGLFFLATVYGYLRAQGHAGAIERRRRMAFTLIAYALSLLAKATAMTLPVVLLLLDIYPLKRLRLEWPVRFNPAMREILWQKLPFFLLAMLFSVFALFAQESTGALRPVQNYFASYRFGQAFYGLCFYLWKTLVPLPLSPLYELPYDFAAWMPLFLACGAAVVAMSLVSFMLRRRWPALLACWVYYLVVVAPVLGVAQSGPQLVADRYSYLSCLSWALLAGGGFYQLLHVAAGHSDRRVHVAVPAALASAVLVILGFLTWKQTKVWRDSETLWSHVIAVGPDSGIAHYNFAQIVERQGMLPESLEYYRRAVAINPAYADARYNLARLLAKQGMHDQAIEQYREALKVRPADPDARNNLGLLLALRGEVDASLLEFERAVQADPHYAKAFFNMGRVLARQGDFDKAAQNLQQALRLSPNEVEVHLELGKVLAQQGRLDAAATQFQAAVKLKPNLAEAYVLLARSLATQGKKHEAEEYYQQALRLLEAERQTPPSQRHKQQ